MSCCKRLRGKIAFGASANCVADRVECGDFVQVRSRLELETTDRSLQATSEGALTLRRTDLRARRASPEHLAISSNWRVLSRMARKGTEGWAIIACATTLMF